MFAITLSIWLHSWSEHQHEQKYAHQFLTELKEDLGADIKQLEENKNSAIMLNNNYKFMLSLQEKRVNDSLIWPHTSFSLLPTNFNVGQYEGFKSSGKIGTIENNDLKNKMLTYYQQTIPNLVFTINFLNNEQLKILDEDNKDKPIYEALTTQKMQRKYRNLQYNTKNLILNYEDAIQQIENIIAEINREK